ncbi:MAG: hypothetical protein GXZ08_07930 [Tissierellia bacterium]|nr:hypothetical protein [Tissierellia bacterium]
MNNKRLFGYFEVIFDIGYLFLAFFISAYILLMKSGKINTLGAILGFVLVIGDSFHLVPRIKFILSNDDKYIKSMGFGKLITSITMTIFYVILWNIGTMMFHSNLNSLINWSVYILAGIRIVISILPQNKWTDKNPPEKWGVYRNIPFAILGLIVAILFFINRNSVLSIKWIWLGIVLSFAFYIPVVLYSNRNKMVGMLMLPKTIMYIWMLFMIASM